MSRYMKNYAILYGAIFGLLAVVFGAFGAHALKEQLSPSVLMSYQTGIRFQMYHAIVLLAIGLLVRQNERNEFRLINRLFIIGTSLFSFSIYLLSINSLIDQIDFKWLGPITPIGGTILITAWVLLVIKGYKWIDK